ETDKATMELESFFDGTILKIFAPAGAQVELGAPLCAIGKPGEKVDAPAGKAPAAVAPAPKQEEKKSEPAPSKSEEKKAEPVATSASESKSAAPAPAQSPVSNHQSPATEGRLKISP